MSARNPFQTTGANHPLATPSVILVTGATGYIGGRLVPRLLECGFAVRCLVRDRARIPPRLRKLAIEVVEGNVLDANSLGDALTGVDAAYYLVHSLRSGRDFHQRDMSAAHNFGMAAAQNKVRRIIYLGGLGNPDTDLSEHLRSRQRTADALRETGVPLTELRAGVIVGSGSLSFEMVRYLTERLPMMICPRWVYTRVQPIAIRDVLTYLVGCLDNPATAGRIIEIGGADVLSYADMIFQYAEARGLKRWLIPVPVLTPRLSSYWVHLVTPIPASIARPLVAGLRNEAVVRHSSATELFPQIRPLPYRAAVDLALDKLRTGNIETVWNDALASGSRTGGAAELTTHEGMIVERRQLTVKAPPDALFRSFSGIGGDNGWLYMNWAWRLRGALDRLLGGVGLRPGRRHPQEIFAGEALDFWRVEKAEPSRLLRLRAEMKVPGRAWLQFEVEPQGQGSLFTQTAFFAPKGLGGLLYWYALYPFHALIFRGMHRRIASRARSFPALSPKPVD